MIPDWGTKILHARVRKQKKKRHNQWIEKANCGMGENIQKYISDKELILGMFKELLQLNNNNHQKKKKTKKPNLKIDKRNCPKALGIFPKDDT